MTSNYVFCRRLGKYITIKKQSTLTRYGGSIFSGVLTGCGQLFELIIFGCEDDTHEQTLYNIHKFSTMTVIYRVFRFFKFTTGETRRRYTPMSCLYLCPW